jgi:hypothetical protein
VKAAYFGDKPDDIEDAEKSFEEEKKFWRF